MDFAGVIAPKDFIDYFWFFVIPKRIARLERIPLYQALKFVEREYWSTPNDSIEWYLPSYWMDRFGISAEERDLILESLIVAEPYGDALEVVPILAMHYEIVISTNTPRNFVKEFLSLYPQIGRYIKAVYSCLDDMVKPKKDREFFKFVAKSLGLKPSQVLHVGDDPKYDVEEAKLAGLRAMLLDRSSKVASSGIRDLYQLLHELL